MPAVRLCKVVDDVVVAQPDTVTAKQAANIILMKYPLWNTTLNHVFQVEYNCLEYIPTGIYAVVDGSVPPTQCAMIFILMSTESCGKS